MDEATRSSGTERAADWRWHPATAWAPLAGVALVLLVTLAFGRLIGFTRDAFEPVVAPADAEDAGSDEVRAPSAPPPTPLELEARELHARVTWCLSAIVLTLALCVAACVAVQVARAGLRPLGARGRRWLTCGALVCLLLGILVWRRQEVVLPGVLQERVDLLEHGVKQVRELSKGAAVAVILALLLAMCATLGPLERAPEALAERVRRMRVLLFVSGGLLVAGVLEISFLLRWPLTSLEPPESKALGDLGASVTAAAGGVLAMLLVAAYGLSSWILMERARAIAPDRPEPERRKWLAENGLDSTLAQHLSRALVMISPWVASGPLAAMLDSIG